MSEELKPCKICGRKPIIERWRSGGIMYMVKCNNPDCPVPVVSYPTGRNLDAVVKQLKEWTFNADVNISDGTMTNHDLISSKNAIEIVKDGGVDGN